MPRHKDLEYQVSVRDKTIGTFPTTTEAAQMAIARAVSSGEPVTIDVITWSRAAAHAYGGDAAVEVYDEDPEASVHEHIVIRAESLGRVS